MDPKYDIARAQTRLEAAAQAYIERSDSNAKTVSAIEMEHYQIIYVDHPRSWRIALRNDNTEEFIEEVFQIHGVLCGYDLPPIQTKDISNLKKKATYLRQAVRLTGLSTPTFTNTMEKIGDIYNIISKQIDADIRIHWETTAYEGHESVDINARYFTHRKNAPHERGQTFEFGVDPDGVLANIRGQDLIHGSDNKVDYLSEHKDEDGDTKLMRVEPTLFQIGDIVRATVSFVAFPTKDKRANMTIVLKALTHVETIRNKQKNEMGAKNIQKTAIIKKKIIFDEEREAREGIANMNINDRMKDSDEE